MRCPLVHVCIWFVLGMLIADGLADIIHLNHILLLCAIAVFFVALVICHINVLRMGTYVSLALFNVLLGLTLFSVCYDKVRQAVPTKEHVLVGVVDELPVKKPRTWAVRLECENSTEILSYIKVSEPPAIGDTIELEPLSITPTCPLDAADNTFGYYMRYLFYSGISATVYTDSAHILVRPCSDGKLLVNDAAARSHLSEIYHEAGIGGDEGTIIEAVTIGDKRELTRSQRLQYAKAGVSHVLALSGYHLSLIYALLEIFFLSRFVALRWRWISHLLVLVVLWAFSWLAGMPPSLLRATIMISVMIVSGVFYRGGLSLNSLAIAALLMLMLNPLMLLDVGFQLSFVSMLGIIVIGLPVIRSFQGMNWIAYKVLPVIVITLVCTLFTAPLVAYYFHQIPLLSVVSNLCITLLIPLVLTVASLWWMSCLAPLVQPALTAILMGLVGTMNSIVDFVASIPMTTISWQPNLLGIMLFYIILFSILGIFYYLCKSKIKTLEY